MDANQIVAAVVEHERAKRGLNRSQLAALLGVNPMWVSRKLNGDRAWTVEDLDLLSRKLDIPLPVLLMEPREAVTLRFRSAGTVITRKYDSLVSRATGLTAVGA